jgi:hypothetical protein
LFRRNESEYDQDFEEDSIEEAPKLQEVQKVKVEELAFVLDEVIDGGTDDDDDDDDESTIKSQSFGSLKPKETKKVEKDGLLVFFGTTFHLVLYVSWVDDISYENESFEEDSNEQVAFERIVSDDGQKDTCVFRLKFVKSFFKF